MDASNPYQAPRSELIAPAQESVGFQITPRMSEHLLRTKPWTRLLSIMGFIATAFMVMGGFGIILTSAFLKGEMGGGVGVGMGVGYLALSLLYFIPSLLLFRYGTAMANTATAGTAMAMDELLEAQRKFWKFLGVLSLVSLVAMMLVFVGAMFVAMAGIGKS
jgi:hypothetical protein